MSIKKEPLSCSSVRRGDHIYEVASNGKVTARPAEPPEEEHWGNYVLVEHPDDKEEMLRACEFVFDETMKELKRAAFKEPEKYFIVKRESDKDLLSANTVAFKVSVRIKR